MVSRFTYGHFHMMGAPVPYDPDLDFMLEVVDRDEAGRIIGMKPGYTGGPLTDEQLARYKTRRRNRLQVLGLPEWERG
ncbi:MAG: hypothetical protein IH888_04240 [Planctomycetes bacterium]|nr:hypothetical protein [Planctomycetota bacterium]